MARPKTPEPQAPRVPAAIYEIPAGMADSDLGLSTTRTCNPWAMDRVLGFLGAHSVDIVDSVAVSNSGKYAELIREGNNLLIFDKL